MKPQDPTPAEIAERCLRIQAEWSPEMRMRRLRCDLRPMVRTADDRLVDMTAADYDQHHGAAGEGYAGGALVPP